MKNNFNLKKEQLNKRGQVNKRMHILPQGKSAQVTVFIIIAVVIVAVLLIYLIVSSIVSDERVPKEIEHVYSYYLSCVDEIAGEGALILGEQGGYIDVPEFVSGSEYMPFSSQLDFLGLGIPYWYYVSGNGIHNEQVPSKAKMQTELDKYIEDNIYLCDFSIFGAEGIEVGLGEIKIDSVIRDNEIEVKIDQDLEINTGDTSFRQIRHSSEINSQLGKFYDTALRIYEDEQESLFLENYAVDILRLYAPVDGSEIGCSPLVWKVNDIQEELTQGVEANIPFTKIKGNYYELEDESHDYFVKDIGVDVDMDINFMYSRDWPMKFEVWPEDDGLLVVEPVGLQEGMGMLGFCYTNYHFVYDFAYPVMIQLYSGSEMFQFPVVVSIDKNKPRDAGDVVGYADVVPELCENKDAVVRVDTIDGDLNPVEARIKYKCFDTVCSIGETKSDGSDAALIANFPQCVNGFILASAEGYESAKYQISTTSEDEALIMLNKKYKLDLEVRTSDGKISDYAVLNFIKDNRSITVAYPEQTEIELTDGQYEIRAYLYTNSSINLKGSSTEKCVEVPESGIFGLFGGTDEKCFNMEIPDQVVSSAVSGGGNDIEYLTGFELEESEKLIVEATNFGKPATVEDLQENYNLVEISELEVYFE